MHWQPAVSVVAGYLRGTLLLGGLVVSLLPASLAQAQPASSQEYPFLTFVKQQATELRANDTPAQTLADWEKQKRALRSQLEQIWGIFEEPRCELKPQILGKVQREGYHVEKLIFQTLPDVWMTANAYVPEGTGPFPAVLCVHGHGANGKLGDAVQSRSITLARLGFFVLAVDAFGAGERGIGKELGEYHGAQVAATLFPIGLPLSGLQVYENMRAVDYLETRPEVDSKRLGITGASGGGNQTMYAGAWDERFQAVVPVCSVGNYQAYLGAACCLCEVVPGALQFTEEAGVLSLIAPRALMVINATQDSFQFSVGAARKSLQATAPVYEHYQAVDKGPVQVSIVAGHGYNRDMREAMYGWMVSHLQGKTVSEKIAEPEHQTEDPETLRCFPGNSRPDNWTTLPLLAGRAGQKLLDAQEKSTPVEQWLKTTAEAKTRLQQILGPVPKSQPRLLSSQNLTEQQQQLVIETEPGIQLQLTRYAGRTKPAESLTLILCLDDTGNLRTSALAEAVQQAGGTAAVLPLRATGEQKYSRDQVRDLSDHNTAEWSLWIGRPLLGQWVQDIRATLDLLQQQGELPKQVTLVGYDSAALVAVAAGVLDSRVSRVVAENLLSSYVTSAPYEKLRLGAVLPGVVREVGDVPRIAALLAPRPLLLSGSVNAQAQPLSPEKMTENFRFTRSAYQKQQAEGQLQLNEALSQEQLVRKLVAE